MKMDVNLQDAIAELLDLTTEEIEQNLDLTFLELGGTSVKALELTFRLDALGKPLDIETLLAEESSLSKLSQLLNEDTSGETGSEGPSSDGSTTSVQTPDTQTSEEKGDNTTTQSTYTREASQRLKCSEHDIECILPLTSQQRGIWLGSLQASTAYLSHWRFQLSEDVDLERLTRAWERVVSANAIFRTRIVSLSDFKLYQVVLTKGFYENEQNLLQQTNIIAEEAGPLFGIHIDESRCLHIRCHHALYDRWSMKLILEDAQFAYENNHDPTLRPSYVPFLETLNQTELDAQTDKWRSTVGEESAVPVPSINRSNGFPLATESIEITAPMVQPGKATLAQIIAAAWSFISSKHAGSNRVSFGLTIWGRDRALPGVTKMAFPTFNTMPFVATVAVDDTIGSLLGTTRSQFSLLRQTQRLSIEDISSINSACRSACRFNSIVVVQQDKPMPTVDGLFSSANLLEFDTIQSSPLVLECTPGEQQLTLRLKFDQSFVARIDAESMLHHTRTALEKFSSGSDQRLNEVDLLGERDLQLIRNWVVPSIELRQKTLHNLVEESATIHANSTAIWTTEVTLTYSKLLQYGRNVARKISCSDIKVSPNIGLCFEKSAYAVVAMLGVSMSGHAFVPMDASNPFNRLMQIYENAQMSLVVCSRAMAPRFAEKNIATVIVDAETLSEKLNSPAKSKESNPKSTVYIIYTSGSTGEPKGVTMTHQALCTTLEAIADHLEFDTDTRDLQFSSFAFDMSVHDIWCTLLRGGTLCIPTEAERFELEAFLDRARCNYAMLTPSVALTLSEGAWRKFKKMSVSGEPCPKAVIQSAQQAGVKFWNTYGPTESCVICITNLTNETNVRPSRLGYSMAATSWIIDADNPHRLAPVGCVGELALTGHTLAAGYFRDAEKTDTAFMPDLKWTHGFPDHALEKVYRTGDLAKYNSDGSIEFEGRLGGYIKIAGNRVDLGEIEYALHSKCDLPRVSVQYCTIGTSEKRELLVGFFVESTATQHEEVKILPFTKIMKERAAKSLHRLREHVPRYMIPVLLFPITSLPYNTAGKLDRKQLISLISERDVEESLAQYGVDTQTSEDSEKSVEEGDLTKEAAILQEAWTTVLKPDSSKISGRSNFFELGGDSLRAMGLGATLRRMKFSIPVSDIFRHPTLSDMSSCLQAVDCEDASSKNENIWSSEELDRLKSAAAKTLKLETQQIEDLLPCTSLQTQMLAASAQASTYIHRECFRLDSNIADAEIHSVCTSLLQQNELLRSRAFVDEQTGAFVSVIMKSSTTIPFEEKSTTLEEHVTSTANLLGLERDLTRFVLLHHEQMRTLVWETHHSIFDGYSNILLIKQFRENAARYQSNTTSAAVVSPVASFKDFVLFSLNADQDAARAFWTRYLDKAPKLDLALRQSSSPSRATNAKTSRRMDYTIPRSEFTTAIMIRAAFAITLSRYVYSNDVVFSATNHGRDLPVKNIESLAGPTFSTLPVRCVLKHNESLADFMSRLQIEAAEISSYQYLPVETISSINSACRQACQFDVHLLIQSASSQPPFDELKDLGYSSQPDPLPMSLQIPFNLVVTAKQSVIDFDVIYNETMYPDEQIDLFLDQFLCTLKQVFSTDKSKPVNAISNLGEQNHSTYLSIQPDISDSESNGSTTIPELVFNDLNLRKDKQAIFSTEKCYTYQEMYEVVSALSREIRESVAEHVRYVAVAYEKSAWAIMAQLAVMTAGHAYVSIDLSWTEAKIKTVIEQTNAAFIITSTLASKKLHNLQVESRLFDAKYVQGRSEPPVPFSLWAQTCNPAYVIFTSGSTGTPKGVVVEHNAICHVLRKHGQRLEFTDKTRGLLFASFSFDASVLETWSILAAGGTLCIANDKERIGDMDNFLTTSKAEHLILTPTSAMLLDPTKHDHVKSLLFCGEKTKTKDIARWTAKSDIRLANGYGPSEASVNAVMNTNFSKDDLSNIGQTMGGGLCIVNPDDYNMLVPVGGIGELLITGQVLAKEYLNDPEKTNEKFVHPEWLEWMNMQGQTAYKTGDLVRLHPDSSLHFLGRHDGQMKVNGIRIEAGEIESIAQQSPVESLEDILVSARPVSDNERGDEMILFFVPDDQTFVNGLVTSILPLSKAYRRTTEQLYNHLKDSLSESHLPSLYVPVSNIPLTTSGKRDQKKLVQALNELHESQVNVYRSTLADASASNTSQAVEITDDTKMSSTESDLASLWAQVLNHTNKASITPMSHFIQCGGDSIKAIRLSSIAKSNTIDLPVNTIYANPVLKDMAAAVDAKRTNMSSLGDLTSPAPFELLAEDALSPLVTRKTPGATKGRQDYFGSL